MQNLRKKNHNFPFLQVHTLDRVFQCPQCEKGFKEQRTLRLHLKIHNAEYPEQCSVCQKVFRTKWQLKQHQMDHGGERPYPCPECSFTCKTKQQLNEHRRKHSVSTSDYFRTSPLSATDIIINLRRFASGFVVIFYRRLKLFSGPFSKVWERDRRTCWG